VEHFPCGNEGYDPTSPTIRTTSCCLPIFDRDYRPILGFETFLGTPYATTALAGCDTAPASSWLPADDYVEIK